MGLNQRGTKLLLYAKSLGVSFENTLTIGRQGLHIDKDNLKRNLDEYNFTGVNAADILTKDNGYSEQFFKLLGAKEVHSIDASGYESATFIHDMNNPVAETLKRKYNVVIDGGSLEHIFNFPVAIKNCMEMVKTDGYFLGITPANNFLGHGFYQFSPELYFRVFSPENGFRIERLFFYNDKNNCKWYEVKDPNEVKSRVILSNRYPSNLFVMAKKIADVPVFAASPMQSDYQHLLWEGIGSVKTQLQNNQRKISYSVKLSNLIGQATSFFKEIGTGNPDFFKENKL